MENIDWLAMNLGRICACMPDLCLHAMEMNGESGRTYTISWKNEKLSRTARYALAAEVQAAANIMGEEMQGLDEGTTGLGLTTDSKSLQEVCQVDNPSEDKGTAVDTAVIRRLADMDIYTSSQKTSRHEHPQHRVEPSKISDSRPPNKTKSLPQQVRQALMFRQTDTGFQLRCVSNESGTNVPTKIFMFHSTTQQDSPHVLTDRHGVLALFASKELGMSVWAKMFVFYPTTPRSQQVAGKVPAPTVSMTINKGRVLSSTTL